MSLRASRTSYHNGRVTVWQGDCRDVLAGMEPDSFDSAVVDPPYHFASIVKRFGSDGAAPAKSNGATGVYKRASTGFMSCKWDGGQIAHEPATWAAVLRVLKPGAHLVAFHADKNYHRLVCAIEDAGFEIRHMLLYLYGSGFPKSHDVSKAIDRELGAEREIIGDSLFASRKPNGSAGVNSVGLSSTPGAVITAPVSDLVREWAGWGTALKPSVEPICLARKPLAPGKTIAGNVMEFGTGALNIGACMVDGGERDARAQVKGTGSASIFGQCRGKSGMAAGTTTLGRWPANILHDGSKEVVEGFPESESTKLNCTQQARDPKSKGAEQSRIRIDEGFADSGSAARFFYTAKADADDRIGSRHPTVKPLDLIQWLCRLITPPKGHILDCFAGTGTTAEAALREGFQCTLIEREAEYLTDIDRRMALAFEGSVGRSVAMAKLKPEGEPLPLFAEAAE